MDLWVQGGPRHSSDCGACKEVGGWGGGGLGDTHIRHKSAIGVPDDDSLVDVDWCQSVSPLRHLQHQRQHYREIFAAGSYNHVLCSSCMLRLPHPQLSLHSAPGCSDELIDTICHLLSQSEKEREPNRGGLLLRHSSSSTVVTSGPLGRQYRMYCTILALLNPIIHLVCFLN